MTSGEPKGILAGGNFIVDHIKQIDHYPEQDQLALVRSETLSNGGGPYNLLKDLAAMGVEIPLQAVGLIGDDENGRWILDDCRRNRIDTQHLQCTAQADTAWTDVMAVVPTGRRTFFHHAGAHALLNPQHFNFDATTARVFYLGYLTLLDQLDTLDAQGRIAASYVCQQAQSAGLITFADTVSGNHPRFPEIVSGVAPYLDYLLLNELEAGWLVGRRLHDDLENVDALQAAAREIVALGVGVAVVLHCQHGAVCVYRDGSCYVQGAVRLREEMIRGTVGAGDAFAAGFIYGAHEGAPPVQCLAQGVCCAAACLTDSTPSAGLRSISDCVQLGNEYGYHSFG